MIDDDVFVVDMAAWDSRHGRLLKLSHGGRHAPEVVLRELFQPNAVVRGPGRTLYVGITGQVLQVDPYAADPARSVRVVVDGLPTTGRHPVPSLAVTAMARCSSTSARPPITATRRAAASPTRRRRAPRRRRARRAARCCAFPPRATTWNAGEQPPYARGLRNSMAMAVLPDGQLAVAVNARDGINHADAALSDAALPHDLLIVLQEGGDYGWPYCYDQRVASPEYPGFDCATSSAPDLLLPAHAAPLGMLLYDGDKLPGLAGKLVIGYHGYRATGHRIVAVSLDKASRPAGTPPSSSPTGNSATASIRKARPWGSWRWPTAAC